MAEKKLVLVVDDDADIRRILREVLEDEGYAVATAGDGREALDQLRALPAPPSLILLDLMMPVMDGWQFRDVQAKDAALGGIPVIVLSADAAVQTKASSLGVAGHLKKPVQLEALLQAIQTHCAGPARADG